MKRYILKEPMLSGSLVWLITDSDEYVQTVREIEGVISINHLVGNTYSIWLNELYDSIEVWCRIDDALNELTKPSIWELELE